MSEGSSIAPKSSLQIFSKKDNYFWKGGGGWSISPTSLWKYSCAISRNRERLDFGKPVCQHWKGIKNNPLVLTFPSLSQICDWKPVFVMATSGHQNVILPLTIGHPATPFCCFIWKGRSGLKGWVFFSICSVYRHSFSFFYGGRKEVHVCSGSPHTLCHWNAPVCIMGYGRFWAEHGTKLEMMAKF